VAVNEPQSRLAVPRFEDGVVILLRIRRGEPTPDIFKQLATCQVISAL
jgi:hypothetical protein